MPRPMPHWQAALLKGLVLVAGTMSVAGAFTLFAIGLLANGRGIAELGFSLPIFLLSLAAGLAQGVLGYIGARSLWRAIAARSAQSPAPTALPTATPATFVEEADQSGSATSASGSTTA